MTERFPAIRVTMLPRDTNAYGTIFGGVILSYLDMAGGIELRNTEEFSDRRSTRAKPQNREHGDRLRSGVITSRFTGSNPP